MCIQASVQACPSLCAVQRPDVKQGVTIRGILACIMYYTYYYLLFVLCINIIEEFDFDRRQSRSQGV